VPGGGAVCFLWEASRLDLKAYLTLALSAVQTRWLKTTQQCFVGG